ncbi:hypothetical protein GE21DRAFT_1122403 [Neurospora crassa]|nr:hypothetical protein GE21DRAFT_1122403 [Neurospora crassa]
MSMLYCLVSPAGHEVKAPLLCACPSVIFSRHLQFWRSSLQLLSLFQASDLSVCSFVVRPRFSGSIGANSLPLLLTISIWCSTVSPSYLILRDPDDVSYLPSLVCSLST